MSPLFKAWVSQAVIGLTGGVLGAVGVWAVASPGAGPKAAREARSAAERRSEASGAFEGERLGSLEERLSLVERRLSAQGAVSKYLEQLEPAGAAPDPKLLEGLLAGTHPAFDAAVRAAMERAEVQRSEERKLQAEARTAERAASAADTLSQKLKLDSGQKAQVEHAISTAMLAALELRRQGLAPGDGRPRYPGPNQPDGGASWRRAFNEIRNTLDKEIVQALNEQQNLRFAELRNEDPEVRSILRGLAGGRGEGDLRRGSVAAERNEATENQ